jgi:hypothetical protein
MPFSGLVACMAKGLTVVALLLVYAATPVFADQVVKLKRDGLSDREWNDIKPYFLVKEPWLIDSVAEDDGVDRDRALELIRREKLLIGRIDLDEDGTSELFVHMEMSATCGSAGCSTDVYRLRGGHWVAFSGTSIRTPIEGEPVFTLRDDERWEFYAPSHPSYRYLRKKYLKR